MAGHDQQSGLRVFRFPTQSSTEHVAPLLSPEAKPFYDALKDGAFVLQRCAACGQYQIPPGPVCTHCTSEKLDWAEASGKGVVQSWTTYHRAFLPAFNDLVPYTVLNVTLREGPRLIGRLVSGGAAAIGSPVELVVEQWADGLCVPAFILEDA
jgi:uncharacterized OB-fold protein